MIDWPKELIDSIARRRAVIVIGSGVSANSQNDAGNCPPTWAEFLTDSVNSGGAGLSFVKKTIKKGMYLEACDYLKTIYGEQAWKTRIKQAFVDPGYKPAEIHRAIFDLDCRIVASLNFDRIYDSYATARSEGTFIIKKYSDGGIRDVVAGSDRYLLKPHGSVDDMSGLIFTLSDYADARIKHSSFYEVFNALLHTHTFLFIGCGLSDPDMQIIFEDYRFKMNECPHYMTQPSPVNKLQKDLISKTRGINIINYSSREGHKELTDSLSDLGSLVERQREIIADNADW